MPECYEVPATPNRKIIHVEARYSLFQVRDLSAWRAALQSVQLICARICSAVSVSPSFVMVASQRDDVEASGHTLPERGMTVIERPPAADGEAMRWVVHPKSSSGVLVELIEGAKPRARGQAI